ELNFAQQWVQSNDPENKSSMVGTSYPTTADTPNSALASADSTPSNTRYYTGNSVAGATNTGWWAQKYDKSNCAALGADSLHDCWLVDGRATVGLSTREVSVVLNGNVNEDT